MDLEKVYVLEWSERQQCFHRHTLGDAIKCNVEAFLEKAGTDYKPVGCGTASQCDDQATILSAMRGI